jgi:hypothetical protein
VTMTDIGAETASPRRRAWQRSSAAMYQDPPRPTPV